MGEDSADLTAVKVPGVPSAAIRQDAAVKVAGLVAQPWTMNDRSGVSFRAARVEPAVAAAKASEQEGGGARATVREGAGAAAKRATVPSTHQTRCASTWPLHQE